jgi:hypothetical protein
MSLQWEVNQFQYHLQHSYLISDRVCGGQFLFYVRFEFFTAVNMKNAIFWDVSPCLQPPAHAGSSLADFFFFLP